jgi:aldehyde dehydrogenase (NAD+)
MNTITKQYIDGAFVESHGREVMDIVNRTNGKAIVRVTLADEEDARRAGREFGTFGIEAFLEPRAILE